MHLIVSMLLFTWLSVIEVGPVPPAPTLPDAYRIVRNVDRTWSGTVTTTDITLDAEILGESTVKDIVSVLRTAEKGDVVNFRLAGYGGDADSVLYITNNIHASKATVNMIVESPSYSGHAYLATQGNTLTMRPYTFLMFHSSSVLGVDCNEYITATDRGRSAVPECEQQKAINLYENKKFIDGIPFLLTEEKVEIMSGGDIYITSEEYNLRASDHNQAHWTSAVLQQASTIIPFAISTVH